MARVVVRHLVPGKNGDWVYPEHTPAVRRPPETREAALAFALQHSISDFKVGSKGQITQVKHIKGGWMSLEDYYDWKRQNEMLSAALPEIIQGGYRLNSLVYAINFDVELGPVGIPLPLGPALVVLEVLTLVAAVQAGDYKSAAVALAALIAPYGCIIAIYHGYLFLKGILDKIIGGLVFVGETVHTVGQFIPPFVPLTTEFGQGSRIVPPGTPGYPPGGTILLPEKKPGDNAPV